MALPKENRLSRTDFPSLLRAGRRLSGRSCSLRFHFEGTAGPRLSVVVQSKAASGAVERNRIRRIVTEDMRKLIPSMKRGTRVAVVIHSPAHRSEPRAYAREAASLLEKSGIITL